MENCGRKLEREEDRKIMAEKEHPGIGTPATQAPTIQGLFDYEYVMQEKNKIISTPKGRKLIEIISPDLKTPALTATWELKLKKIQEREMSVPQYREELHAYVSKIIDESKKLVGKIDFRAGDKTEFSCPACGRTIMKKAWGYSCESKECGFSVSLKIADKTLSEKQIEGLLKDGETSLIKGFKGSKGPFDAKLVIRDRKEGGKEVGFEFETIPCPKCKTGTIRIFEWGAACSDREKCGFKVFREMAHKKLTDSLLKKLVLYGKTQTINGFKNKEGREFNAQVILDKSFKAVFTFN
jgi:DNA topoisomerase-3